ncbi:hypothetical protein BS17DRAFT_812850 [Gyrodon lividus]|nr:hypothetical protein BS17DRAFT_812850 [Gyrodon lividus]
MALTSAIHGLPNITCCMEFNRITSQVHGYGEGAHHHFYSRLLDHIKDKVSCVGKPITLTELCALSQGINAHYWECKSEINCHKTANLPPSKTYTLSSAKSVPNPANPASANNSNSKANALPPHLSQTNPSQKLGKDGKLTSKE